MSSPSQGSTTPPPKPAKQSQASKSKGSRRKPLADVKVAENESTHTPRPDRKTKAAAVYGSMDELMDLLPRRPGVCLRRRAAAATETKASRPGRKASKRGRTTKASTTRRPRSRTGSKQVADSYGEEVVGEKEGESFVFLGDEREVSRLKSTCSEDGLGANCDRNTSGNEQHGGRTLLVWMGMRWRRRGRG